MKFLKSHFTSIAKLGVTVSVCKLCANKEKSSYKIYL